MIITPRTTGHLIRAQSGLKPPKHPYKLISPEGITLHWNGPPLNGPWRTDWTRCACRKHIRAIQKYHQDVRQWNDIAYNIAVCQAGHVLNCRGFSVRSAAQGTDAGNRVSMALLALIGVGQKPTPELLNGIAWSRQWYMTQGMGGAVWPHSYWHTTDCPGPELRKIANNGGFTTGLEDDELRDDERRWLKAIFDTLSDEAGWRSGDGPVPMVIGQRTDDIVGLLAEHYPPPNGPRTGKFELLNKRITELETAITRQTDLLRRLADELSPEKIRDDAP